VAAYRLIGYENRMLRNQDFNDDTKDAGEMGAGHSVTALYELIPAGKDLAIPGVDPLKYQDTRAMSSKAFSGELLTVKLRYKEPARNSSKKLEFPVQDSFGSWQQASDNFNFSASVAAFGMLLRDSKYKGKASFQKVLQIAQNARGHDEHGYRGEFIKLVEMASKLKLSATSAEERK